MKTHRTLIVLVALQIATLGSPNYAPAAARTWTGATSTSWNVASNWSPAIIPVLADDITIPTSPTGGRFPVLTSSDSVRIHNFIIQAGASFTQDGGKLYINDLTVAATGIYTQNAGTLFVDHDWKNSGTFSSTAGTVQFTGSGGGAADYSTGTNQFCNIVVDPGADPKFDNAANSQILIKGNFTNLNTGLDVNNKATFTFNGTSNQTMTSAATKKTFGNVVIDNPSGTVSLLSDIMVDGNVTVTRGTLDLGNHVLKNETNGVGTLTVANGATLKVGGSFPPNFGTVSLGATSTVEYNGNNQIIKNGFAYGNLVIAGTGTSTAAGALTVQGDLTIRPWATLNMGGFPLTVNGRVLYRQIFASVKVMLQGPFGAGDSMNNLLKTGGHLAARFGSIPIPGLAVDSITIELRDSLTAAKSTIRKLVPAWLLTNGSIRRFADTLANSVAFDSMSVGNYFLAVRHRNHLAVMCAAPMTLNESNTLYDFTTGSGQYYGGAAGARDLGSGRWGMCAGNSNGDNIITVLDYNAVGSQIFQSGYRGGDHDLNGIITVLDYNPVGQNIFKSSQVN